MVLFLLRNEIEFAGNHQMMSAYWGARNLYAGRAQSTNRLRASRQNKVDGLRAYRD